MDKFKQYRRTQIAEMRDIEQEDIEHFNSHAGVLHDENGKQISISEADRNAGSPKLGDMVARNPKNHDDKWLVAKEYFEDNFESF